MSADPRVVTALRQSDLFSHFGGQHLGLLAGVAEWIELADGQLLVRRGDPTRELFVVLAGELVASAETPVGPTIFGTVSAGELVGELAFLDAAERASDVVSRGRSELLKFSSARLAAVFLVSKEIEVAFLWAFWRGLAAKLRRSDAALAKFFAGDRLRVTQSLPQSISEEVDVEFGAKVDALRDRGLGEADMARLASVATSRRIPAGAAVFTEGMPGSELFVIADGQVRISKRIRGIGEEALAILGRGDVFGEMALVDASPRSADATAHDGDATVLVIERSALDGVLGLDPQSATHVLRLLVAILARRLRELDDKLVSWTTLSGGRS